MPQALDPVTQKHIAERLAGEVAGIFSLETIARYMADRGICSATRASTRSSRYSPIASPVSV